MTAIALAGAGFVSVVHGLAAKRAGFAVTAVASRSTARATARAAQLGARGVRYDELPAGADVVVIATPPADHVERALGLLRAGTAVTIETPLCTTLDDADRLVAASQTYGGRVGYAENLAYAPIVTEFVHRVRQMGALRHFSLRAVQARPTWGEHLTPGWGGGALFDLGCHPIAIALLACAPNEPTWVSADAYGTDDHPLDDHAEVRLGFESGLVVYLTISWRGTATPNWDAQAATDSGALRAELLPQPLLEQNGVEVPLIPVIGQYPQLEQYGYAGQLRAAVQAFANGGRPLADAAFGRRVLEVICASAWSASHGSVSTPLPFAGPRDRTPWELWQG